jgi:hypothetical protein
MVRTESKREDFDFAGRKYNHLVKVGDYSEAMHQSTPSGGEQSGRKVTFQLKLKSKS